MSNKGGTELKTGTGVANKASLHAIQDAAPSVWLDNISSYGRDASVPGNPAARGKSLIQTFVPALVWQVGLSDPVTLSFQ